MKRRKKRLRKPSLFKLARLADRALSLYIREKTFREFGKCPLCLVNPIQCSFHFISRRRRALRWDERNVVGGCHSCNWWERYFPDLSRAWFIEHRGVDTYLTLVRAAKEKKEFDREELERIAATYKKSLEDMGPR